MGLLLVILTSSINILVLYLLGLLAIYLQIDICPRFIYKLILFLNKIIKICFTNCFKLDFKLCFNYVLNYVLNCVLNCVSLYVSICILVYVSTSCFNLSSISIKGIILSHNYKFISRVGFTKGFTSVLRRIILSLASWQLSIYTSLNFH